MGWFVERKIIWSRQRHFVCGVTGIAQQTISGMFYDGSLYHTALQALQERFGEDESIIQANLNKQAKLCINYSNFDFVCYTQLMSYNNMCRNYNLYCCVKFHVYSLQERLI